MAACRRWLSKYLNFFHNQYHSEAFLFRNTVKSRIHNRICSYLGHFKETSVLWLQILNKHSNRLRNRGLVSSVAVSVAFAFSKSQEPSKPDIQTLHHADDLFENDEIVKLYNILYQFKDSDDAQLLWRFARAARSYAQIAGTSDESKKLLIYEAFNAAEKAVKLDEKSFACNKWFGIMLSEVGDYEGTKKKIENSYIIRDHFLKAIELNPADPTSHYLLGVWYFTFADLPWYQKKLAAAIFASPPNCSYEEAAEHFLHAEKIEPGFYIANQLMLAKTYLRLGQKETARRWIDKLLKCPAVTQEDKLNIEEAKKILNSF